MHQFPYPLNLAVDPPSELPCTSTPLLKSADASHDHPITPRLRSSMSSHSRLMPDDQIDGSRPFEIGSFENAEQETGATDGKQRRQEGPSIMDLPEEIHQRVLDMLMGELRPAASRSADGNHALRNWNHAMRHPKGRQLAALSLVTPSWRRLVQERIYRHIKIQGASNGLLECYTWFGANPRLGSYVRHIEFWVPVWERRGGERDIRDPTSTTPMDLAVQFPDRLRPIFVIPGRDGVVSAEPLSSSYKLSSQKATLAEIFFCIETLFQSARVLTLEGGHCKKPPMIEHFRRQSSSQSITRFMELPNIQTLILRGAWNMMREEKHFDNLREALPAVREWHCNFTKPKSKVYYMMYKIVRNFPLNITHLNLCLEGFYSKKMIHIAKMQTLQREHHLCEAIGRIMPQLEALTLTGRMCGHLFSHAIDAATKTRKARLKSLDLVVKNCCRGLDVWNDGIGIHNWSFIAAFEHLVTSSSRALKYYPDLSSLRIRFVDLDAPAPLLNPYFQLQNNELTGIWNEQILHNIQHSRPSARYVDIADSFSQSAGVYMPYPTTRPKSMRTSIYQIWSANAGNPW